MASDQGCGGRVCGDPNCPCPICHGDPAEWLKAKHGGRPVKGDDGFPTGETQCNECDRIS